MKRKYKISLVVLILTAVGFYTILKNLTKDIDFGTFEDDEEEEDL